MIVTGITYLSVCLSDYLAVPSKFTSPPGQPCSLTVHTGPGSLQPHRKTHCVGSKGWSHQSNRASHLPPASWIDYLSLRERQQHPDRHRPGMLWKCFIWETWNGKPFDTGAWSPSPALSWSHGVSAQLRKARAKASANTDLWAFHTSFNSKRQKKKGKVFWNPQIYWASTCVGGCFNTRTGRVPFRSLCHSALTLSVFLFIHSFILI